MDKVTGVTETITTDVTSIKNNKDTQTSITFIHKEKPNFAQEYTVHATKTVEAPSNPQTITTTAVFVSKQKDAPHVQTTTILDKKTGKVEIL